MTQENWIGLASNLLSWLANLIQVGSFVFVLVVFWKARTELKRYLQSRGTTVSERPCALIIGLGGDITGQVEAFLKDKKWNFPIKPYIRKGYFSPEEFMPILADLHKVKDELTQAGVTEVHLFYRGPVTMAMAIGAITDNWVPVKVYDYKDGTYHYHTTLEKGLVKGLTVGNVMREGESLLTEG